MTDDEMRQRIKEWEWQQRIEVKVYESDGSLLGTATTRQEFESLTGQVLSTRSKEVTLEGTIEGTQYDGPVSRHAVFALIRHWRNVESGNVPCADGPLFHSRA